MKTLLEVKNTYLDTQEEANQVDVEASGGKRLRSRYIKQIQFLYKIIIFLEGNPNAEFLQDQLQTLKKKYNKAMSIKPIPGPGFQTDKLPEYLEKVNKWEKENDISKMKNQLRFINYILK